jgi:glycine hydroxymethyltransferase
MSIANTNPRSIIWDLIDQEAQRQEDHLELIASENYVSPEIMQLQGSLLTNKYAEGYPGRRYYGGCEFVDQIELHAQKLACKLFGTSYANVQPHSGSSANLAVFHALLNPGDKFMGLDLRHGGHLTHGSPVNFSGLLYQAGHYTLDENERLNYDQILEQALEFRPKLIIAGYSAYSRTIDWHAFKAIADKVGAYLMADIAHISGLIATGLHPSPAGIADVITSTTHKTLRGPRGGIILSDDPVLMKKINSSIFPGSQGGPLMHVIAAKARCFELALEQEFYLYQKQILLNAAALCEHLQSRGLKIISQGTDNHLMLISLKDFAFTGKDAQVALEKAKITANRNSIPGDLRSSQLTSGLRIGTPAPTTRGMKEPQMLMIANFIADILQNNLDETTIAHARMGISELCSQFPVYTR